MHFNTETKVGIFKINSSGALNCGNQPYMLFQNAAIVTDSIVNYSVSSVAVSDTIFYPTYSNVILNTLTNCSTVGTTNPERSVRNLVSPTIVFANSIITVQSDQSIENSLIDIFDLQGRPVEFERSVDDHRSLKISIENDISPGLYFLRLIKSGKCETHRLLVQ
jgi:hypothetical protein